MSIVNGACRVNFSIILEQLVIKLTNSGKTCLKVLLTICGYLPDYSYFPADILHIKGVIAQLTKNHSMCSCLCLGLDGEIKQTKLAEMLK